MSALQSAMELARAALAPAADGYFVRVAQAGPLLVTDAPRRERTPGAARTALERAGFHPIEDGVLLRFGLPETAYVLLPAAPPPGGSWNADAWREQALCRRLLLCAATPGPVEPEGRALVDSLLRALSRRQRESALRAFAREAAAARRQGWNRALRLCGVYLCEALHGCGVPQGHAFHATLSKEVIRL